MRVSLVQILTLQESKLGLAKERAADCIGKSSESLTWLDQESCSWKTSQQSFLTGWEPFSQTFPRAGILQGGYVYELPMLARITAEIDGGCLPDGQTFHHTPNTTGLDGGSNSRKALAKRQGLQIWPTPTVKTGAQVSWDKTPGQTGGTSLAGAVQYFPTPQASDNRDRGHMSNPSIIRRKEIGKQIGLSTFVKPDKAPGSLNAQWVAWIMGWPLNHTLIGGALSQTWDELPLKTKTDPTS
jgi:hypothetical protein